MQNTGGFESRSGYLARLMRLVRALGEASLLALGFAAMILLIGTPLGLGVRGIHDVLSWAIPGGGELRAFVVSATSVVGGVALTTMFWRTIVELFHRPR